MKLLTLTVLALILSSASARANSCDNARSSARSRVIDLERDAGYIETNVRDLSIIAERIDRLSAGAANVPNVNLSGAATGLDQVNQNILVATQRMHNVRVLLEEIKDKGDARMRAIAENALSNNLGPAEQAAAAARSVAEQVKSRLSSIDGNLDNALDNVRRLAPSLRSEAQQLRTEVSQNSNLASRVRLSLGTTGYDIDNVARVCAASL